MKRRTVLIGGVSLGLLVGVAILAILTCEAGGSKVTVSYLKSEASHGTFPSYVESERLDFGVRNAGSKTASVYVTGIEDKQGRWVPSLETLGEVRAGQSNQLYLYLPLGSHPRSLRMRVNVKASQVRKAQFALKVLIEKARGRFPIKQAWFSELTVPTYEFVVKVGNEAEQDR